MNSKIYNERLSERIVENTWSEEDIDRLHAEKVATMKSAVDTIDDETYIGTVNDHKRADLIIFAMSDRDSVCESFFDGGLLIRNWHKEFCKLVQAENSLDKLFPNREGKIDLEAFATALGISAEDPYIEPKE